MHIRRIRHPSLEPGNYRIDMSLLSYSPLLGGSIIQGNTSFKPTEPFVRLELDDVRIPLSLQACLIRVKVGKYLLTRLI